MRLCVDLHAHPPYLTPDGGGSVGRLVVAAARDAGLELEFYQATITRWRAEIGLNLVHGFPITPYMPDLLAIVDYPMRAAAPDPARPRFAGRIEALPLPLFERICYLAVSKAFHARNGPTVEALWNAIGRLNQAAKTQKK